MLHRDPARPRPVEVLWVGLGWAEPCTDGKTTLVCVVHYAHFTAGETEVRGEEVSCTPYMDES